MAPETANQKRKRGRPSNVSRDNVDASGSQLTITKQGQLTTASKSTEDLDAEEPSRSRKRRRPANTEAPSQVQPEPEASQPQRTKKKPGPSTAVESNNTARDAGNEEQVTTTTATERRKRGRPRVSDANDGVAEAQEHNKSNVPNENTVPRKRGRRPKGTEAAGENEPEADEADDENEGNSSLLRRSGRVRRSPGSSNQGPQEVAKPADGKGSSSQKLKGRGKRGRSPLAERPINEMEQEPVIQQKKRGRPSLNNQPSVDVEINTEPQDRSKKRARPQPAEENASPSTKRKGKKPRDQPPQNHEPSEQQEENRPGRGRRRRSDDAEPESRKRRQPSNVQERSSSPDSATSPRRYRHLATRTRRIPLNIIESKWTPLEAPAISSVATLLQSASRPVLLRLNNPQRHGQAAAALNAVSKRLRSKISKGLPFPPATTSVRREEEFEFERTVSGIQALESQLDPLLHSVELLRREKERAEKELDREYKVLARLSSNAHAEARERKGRMRKMHVLVPEKLPPESKPEFGSVGEVVPAENGSGKVFADLDDELAGLAGQIANHMESMRGNLQQIEDVVPNIVKSQGLLRATLQSRLDREQLENIILG